MYIAQREFVDHYKSVDPIGKKKHITNSMLLFYVTRRYRITHFKRVT